MAETPEQLLSFSLLDNNREKFMSLFYEPTSTALQKKTNLHLNILRVQNGEFDLPGLYRELKNNSVAYVLSRLNYKKVLDDPSMMMEVATKVQSQFRRPDEKAGEGGELILYSLLEGHLGAPKILSKMELKTSSDHYVHGSDGVHLLQLDANNFQMIFGESKMYGASGKSGNSVERGVKAAFKSIGKVHKEGFDFDTWLVDSELLKEEIDPDKLQALADIILPADANSNVKKHNAFGIFIGYEIDVTDLKPEDFELDELENELIRRATDALEAEHELICKEIADRGLGIYPFHIYAIPFVKRGSSEGDPSITKVRMDLAAQLGYREVSKK